MTGNPSPEAPGGRTAGSILRIGLESADLLIGFVLLALAAWFGWTAYRLDDYSGPSIGPADFPTGLALLLAAGAVLLMLGAVLRWLRRAPLEAVAVRRPAHVAAGMALFVAFPPLMTWLGFYPAMILWLPAFLWLAGTRRPLVIVSYLAGFLVFVRLVFEMLLGTPLP